MKTIINNLKQKLNKNIRESSNKVMELKEENQKQHQHKYSKRI